MHLWGVCTIWCVGTWGVCIPWVCVHHKVGVHHGGVCTMGLCAHGVCMHCEGVSTWSVCGHRGMCVAWGYTMVRTLWGCICTMRVCVHGISVHMGCAIHDMCAHGVCVHIRGVWAPMCTCTKGSPGYMPLAPDLPPQPELLLYPILVLPALVPWRMVQINRPGHTHLTSDFPALEPTTM